MLIKAVIPARYESSRFPGKPLALIKGVPMINRVVAQAIQAVGKNNVIVVTDDERVANIVNCEIIMTGEEFTGTDRIGSVVDKIYADIIINVQGDEPLINPDDIIKIGEEKEKYPECVINGMSCLTNDSKNCVKVIHHKNKMIYMSRNLVSEWKQCGLYAFTRMEVYKFYKHGPGIFDQIENVELLRFIELGIPIRMLEVSNTIAVDIPSDLKVVESFC